MTTLALSAAMALGGLTACSSGGGAAATPTASNSPNAQQVAALYRRLSQCIRDNGAPTFPDLVQDPETGGWEPPRGTEDPPKQAFLACQSIAEQIPKGYGKQRRPVTAADLAKLRRFSACMREQGLRDWPDPNDEGAFPLPERLLRQGKRGFVRELQACKHLQPAGTRGIQVKVPQDDMRKGQNGK
ncbi:hypothetical protein [Actinomadura sp. HBU206391]|uniref:hypothetical protein n=1 Tax=Actinomadura sp. HBU206391 TaxID=2731692 RepID=UPI001C9D072B|nr:hypothetical protein [Actinomadura sp. HBU206391]MBC6461704.1 hypothetical protein [Actinomadura sp. HBU206391]